MLRVSWSVLCKGRGTGIHLDGVVGARQVLVDAGFAALFWEDLARGLRPDPTPDEDPSKPKHGWQYWAMQRLNGQFINAAVWQTVLGPCCGHKVDLLPACLLRVVPFPGTRLSTHRSSVPFSFTACGSLALVQPRLPEPSTRLQWPPCSMCCGGGAWESWVRFGIGSGTRLSGSRWQGHHQQSHPGHGHCQAEPVGRTSH